MRIANFRLLNTICQGAWGLPHRTPPLPHPYQGKANPKPCALAGPTCWPRASIFEGTRQYPPHSRDGEGWAAVPAAHLLQLSHGCERQAARKTVTSDVPERRRRVLGSVSRVPFTHTPCHPQTFPGAMAGTPRLACRLQRWACQKTTAENLVPCSLQGNRPPAAPMAATLPAYAAAANLAITCTSSEAGCVKDPKAHREDPFQHPTSLAWGRARKGLCPQHSHSLPKCPLERVNRAVHSQHKKRGT